MLNVKHGHSVAQRIIITFLVREGGKSSKNLIFSAQLEKTSLSKTQVYDWCKIFKNHEGQSVTVNETNIECVGPFNSWKINK